MKLVINIPCFNEEETLPLVLAGIPKSIPGFDAIEVQVVDDGSSDRTGAIAQQHGCRVVRHNHRLGLGMAFRSGVEHALLHKADVMVNTDGDNQYPSESIADLVAPILAGQADIVIGNREPWKVKHFGWPKRLLQFIGNGLTRRLAGINVPDTVSGFRAYSREAMLRINVLSKFSYTLDTIVQASKKGLQVVSVPIRINPPTRKSRLFRNYFQYITISAAVILRVIVVYEPFKTFLIGSVLFFIPGAFLLGRFLVFFVAGEGSGHVQSLIVAAILVIFSGLLFALGLLADLIGINRRIQEEELYWVKKQSLDQK